MREADFEIWERQLHAVHARGTLRGRRGGTRIEVRLELTRRTQVLSVVFAVLYGVGAYGFVVGPAASSISLSQALIAALGAAAIASIFVLSSLRQRAVLRSFLDRVFREAGAVIDGPEG